MFLFSNRAWSQLILLQQQVKQGIDAVIVDSVLAIRKGLTEKAGTMQKLVEV